MITRKLTTIVAFAALLMVLAACDLQPASPTAVPSSTSTVAVPPNVTVSPGTLAPGALLAYGVTGGIAGFNSALVLEDSGNYTGMSLNGEPKSGTLDQATLGKIKGQLDAVRSMADLQLSYDNGNVADDIYRTVTFESNGTPVAVMVAEQGGKDITPAPLQQLISTLRDAFEKP
ncbi:MAG: hypothetical protein QOH93_877 [Chloroflexia bacterium]|jgi:ABC-type transport system substrate-binding protein|nr:hypothetical protein [Chloroflexia bacterium]